MTTGRIIAGLMVMWLVLWACDLPRTTRALMATGRSVEVDTLAPGDRVFFRLPDGKRHVGIYIERGRFAHAATRRGVMISRLTEPCWQEPYRTARRLLA